MTPVSDNNQRLVDCPFCGLTSCDLIGLKRHFQHGNCDVFNDTPFDDDGERAREANIGANLPANWKP